MNLEALKGSLKAHEGVNKLPYRDSLGNETVGCGHLLDAPMPDKLVDLILEFDISVAVEELDRAVPSWRQHSEARQTVLAELAFNLGMPRLGKFNRFWYAMEQKDYVTASQELLNSKWAEQVKARALVLANRLKDDVLISTNP